MDAERARAFLRTLPHVVETRQWGENLVFWVGDKAIGGKMFCLLDLDAGEQGVASYSAGAERYLERLEREGLKPAPYLARAHWIAAERWSAWRDAEWKDEFCHAYELTWNKLPKKVRDVLALPAAARSHAVRESRKLLAERVLAKAAVRGLKA